MISLSFGFGLVFGRRAALWLFVGRSLLASVLGQHRVNLETKNKKLKLSLDIFCPHLAEEINLLECSKQSQTLCSPMLSP